MRSNGLGIAPGPSFCAGEIGAREEAEPLRRIREALGACAFPIGPAKPERPGIGCEHMQESGREKNEEKLGTFELFSLLQKKISANRHLRRKKSSTKPYILYMIMHN